MRRPSPALLSALLLSLGAGADEVRILPGLANVAGANGTKFESTVWVSSLGAEATLELDLVPFSPDAPPPTVRRTLRAGETLRFDNALSSLFGLSGKAGTLRARSTQPFDLRATTANVAGGPGTYGLGVASVPLAAVLSAGEVGHAIWLTNGPDPARGFRTNVAVVLVTPGSVRLTVVDDGGVVRGESIVSSSVPMSWQRSVADLATDADLATGRVAMTVLEGSAVGYTAVVDNVTGDGIAVPFARAPEGPPETVLGLKGPYSGPTTFLLDGLAKTPGRNGTRWSTDLRLFNPGTVSVDVTLTPTGFASGGASVTRTLAPRAVLEIADVVTALGLPDGVAGAVRLSAPRPFLVEGRTSNVDPSGRPGTFSASIRPTPDARLLPAGSRATLFGLSRTGFRTNVALLAGPSGGEARAVLLDAGGAVLASATAAARPGMWTQQALPDWFSGLATIPADARLDLEVTAGSLDVYASVIDDVTGDPVVLGPTVVAVPGCAPPVVTLTASRASLAAGETATLTLSGSGVAGARVSPGDLAIVPGIPLTVTPSITTTFRATATSSDACALPSTVAATIAVTAPAGTVMTESGPLLGVTARGVTSYKGVPYAAPPEGDLRWRPPAPAAPWPSVRDASRFGSVCPQLSDQGQGPFTGREDCLFLNVFAPATRPASPVPVLFFIHGGGNVQGESSTFLYDGTSLASSGPAVVVTVNYRLGTLGYLVQPFLRAEDRRGVAGNYGILDLLEALRWVKRNIAAFGGDPDRVTIFGESAGAVNVCTLLASPLAGGLFSRALMESGGCTQDTMAHFETFGDTIVKATPCATSTTPGPCLRGLSAETLTTAVPGQANVVTSSGQLFGPNVDGLVLLRSPYEAIKRGEHHHVPFAIGSNADETGQLSPAIATEADYRARVTAQFTVFAPLILAQYPASAFPTPRAAYVALTSDARFTCPARRVARAAASSQAEPVYRYFFTHVLDNVGPAFKTYGAYHSLELFFVFRTITDVPSYTPSALELALSDAMGRYWTRFAASGDPNGGPDVAWPTYDAARDPFLRLDSTIAAGTGVRTAACDFWDPFTP